MTEELETERDTPPAGTPCSSCNALGHFCQADEWCVGDSGYAICDECLNGKECATIKARKPAPDFDVDRLDHPIAPVKHIPVEKTVIALPAPFVPAQARNPYTSDALVARIESLPDGEMIELPLPKDWTQPEFHRDICALLKAAEDRLLERIKITWRKPDLATIIRKDPEKPAPKPKKLKNYVCEGCGKKNEDPKWPEGWARTGPKMKIWCDQCVAKEAWVEPEPVRAPSGYEIFDKSKASPKKEAQPPEKPVEPVAENLAPVELYARVANAKPPKEPPSLMLPTAFEMVAKEVRAHRDSMVDLAAENVDDIDWESAIKEHDNTLAILHDCNPAFLGYAESDKHPSIYERALEQANNELELLKLESQRIALRITALQAIRDVLEANHRNEEDTRS